MADQAYWLWYSLKTQGIPPRLAESYLRRFDGPEPLYNLSVQELNKQIKPPNYRRFMDKDMAEVEGLLRQELKQEIIYQNFQGQKESNKSRDDPAQEQNMWDSVTGILAERAQKVRESPNLDGLSTEERCVYQAIANGANTPDLIIEHTDMSASRVMATVTMMGIGGQASRDYGHIFLNI